MPDVICSLISGLLLTSHNPRSSVAAKSRRDRIWSFGLELSRIEQPVLVVRNRPPPFRRGQSFHVPTKRSFADHDDTTDLTTSSDQSTLTLSVTGGTFGNPPQISAHPLRHIPMHLPIRPRY